MSGTAQQVFEWGGGGDAKEECAKEIFWGGGEAGRGGHAIQSENFAVC